jgi:hypothetical protein
MTHFLGPGVYLSCRLFLHQCVWFSFLTLVCIILQNLTLEQKTGYKVFDLQKSIYVIHELQLTIRCPDQEAIREKYKDPKVHPFSPFCCSNLHFVFCWTLFAWTFYSLGACRQWLHHEKSLHLSLKIAISEVWTLENGFCSNAAGDAENSLMVG